MKKAAARKAPAKKRVTAKVSSAKSPAPETPRYPADLTITYPDHALNRASTFFRLVLLIPGWILIILMGTTGKVMSLGGFVFVPTILLLLIRQKYPRWWFDWNLAIAGFLTRFAVYAALMTDVYPSTDEEQSVHLRLAYPDARRDLNRWLPLIKWLLAVPHYIILAFLNLAAVVVALFAWVAILFTGRFPRTWFGFITGVARWNFRVTAYAFLLVTDLYPPFSLEN